MTKIAFIGFEMASAIELDSSNVTGNWTLDFPTGRRASTYCIRNQSSGNSGFAANWQYNFPSNPTEWFMRFALMPIGSSKTERLYIGAATSGYHLRISVGGGSTLTFNNSAGSALASTTTVLLAGQWYLVEIHYLQHSSGGILQVKIDGVQEINFSGNTASTGSGGLSYFLATTDTGTKGQQIDDLAVNDTSGSVDNSWLGDGWVDFLLPNGDASVQWTPSTGSSNYATVDERTSNGDTDYNSSASSSDKDLLNLTTISLSSGQEISAVQPVVVAKRVVADTPLNLEVGLKSGSTEDFDSGHTLTTTYKTYRGDIYLNNPDDGQAWEQADIDALQVGYRNQ